MTKATKDEFAETRSHEASKTAYDLCRVTAQSCMLINGGSATAVIAFLAKDKVEPVLYSTVPYALAGYATGLLFSALMMFSVMMMADYWNYYWYAVSYTKSDEDADRYELTACRWHKLVYVLFALALVCFLCASWQMTHAFRDLGSKRNDAPAAIVNPLLKK